MNKRATVLIFLSSPTDVLAEREAAERVVSRLSNCAKDVKFVLERWEQHYYEASKGFQEAIGAMEAFDLVVGILWKRIGSELPPGRFRRADGTPFESGTVYEIETALAASRRAGRPTVYIFRKTEAVTYDAERVDEQRAQKEALDRWWDRTFRDETGHYVAGTNDFTATEESIEIVALPLRKGKLPTLQFGIGPKVPSKLFFVGKRGLLVIGRGVKLNSAVDVDGHLRLRNGA